MVNQQKCWYQFSLSRPIIQLGPEHYRHVVPSTDGLAISLHLDNLQLHHLQLHMDNMSSTCIIQCHHSTVFAREAGN
jgi:hypothetical protein